MIKVHLSKSQRKELKTLRHQVSSKNSEKALMVLMSSDGKSVAEISSALKRNPHTVRDWLKRYNRDGLPGLSRKFSPGRPDKKRNITKSHIEKIISGPPSQYGYADNVWSVPLIIHDIKINRNIPVSRDTVLRSLKDLGYTYKRPSKGPPCRAPSRQEKIDAVEEIMGNVKAIMKNEASILYFLDESHFSTEPYLVQGWFKKRQPPQNPDQFQKRKPHILWLLESGNTKILLEKVTQG